jgi:signal transduction histidine kinase
LPRSSEGARRATGFGLRPRLLAALLLTSAVTLAVAALALLPPLKSRLRNAAISQTVSAIEAAKPGLGSIPLLGGLPLRHQLRAQAVRLKQSTGEERVIIWTTEARRPLEDTDPDEDLLGARALARIAATHESTRAHPVHAEEGGLLLVASLYETQQHKFVLELFAKLNYADQATDVVSLAFLEAAGAGLLVALLLGAALSSRLVRRLRMLRDATIGLDDHGLQDLTVADADSRDEIGELAQAFTQMRERLSQQEDARRAFVATASHELRTPLTSLDGMLELLADDLDSERLDIEDARERVASAQEQTRRLSSLASDLLDLSRIDAALELRSEPVELGEIARAVSAEFELRALERGQMISVEGSGGQCWAEGDPSSIARIVRILLDNALRIAPSESTVTVTVGGPELTPTLEVSDNGPGVPPEETELIFERFKRGRSAEAGFGLGLAIGRELAARMNGTLELIDGPPGATFRMRLTGVRTGAQVE